MHMYRNSPYFSGEILSRFLRFRDDANFSVQAVDASAMMDQLFFAFGEGEDGGTRHAPSISAAASFRQQQACSSLLPLFAVETLAAACRSAGVQIRCKTFQVIQI